MLHHLSRVLMNEADASPGGGAVPSPETKPEAQAQGQAPVVAGVSLDDIKALLDAQKNSVEANTRRMIEGALGKKKDGNAPPATKDTAQAAPAPAVDMRAFDRATRRLDLSDSQLARMERSFAAEAPEDVAEWVKSYVNDLGIKTVQEKAVASNSTASTTTTTNTAPASAATPAPASSVPSGPDSVRKWDEHMVRDHLAKNGGDASNPMAWTNRRASIELAQRLANEMAHIRIVGTKK